MRKTRLQRYILTVNNSLSPILAVLCFLQVSLSHAAEQNSFSLTSDQIEVALDAQTGALLSVVNKLTGARKSARDVAFTILTDRGIVTSERVRPVASSHDPGTASFEFESSGLAIKLAYRVPSPQANFVKKLLTVTNRSPRAINLDTLVLEQVAFNPPALQVHFHRAGFVSDRPAISPDVPINLFLRDSGGGIFMGIENPYFGLTKEGNTLSLQFRPRWLLQPGESFSSDPAFLGVYRNQGIYAFKQIEQSEQDKPYSALSTAGTKEGAQELLDWGEVWAMQDFMRQVLTADRPPGKGYPVAYNACGSMEYLWRLCEAPAKFTMEGVLVPGAKISITQEEEQFVKQFFPTKPCVREITHGQFRPAFVEPYRNLIDHLSEIGHVDVLHPGTLWLGNGGFWDKEDPYLSSLEPNAPIKPNPYWLQTIHYAQSKGIGVYGFECPAWGYFPKRTDWKYVGRDGKPTRSNCYANPGFVNWHREAVDRAVTEYHLPWWQWDEGWADVNSGECYATNHGHLPGNVSYAVYHNIQQTTMELKRRHPGLWLVGIAVFQHDCPWILRTVDESVTWGDPWSAHNYLFLPLGKDYVGDFTPRTGQVEYDLLDHISLADHLDLGQPIWFGDATRRDAAQKFWRKWLAWADENFAYLRARRDLFGPPGSDRLEGSAHVLKDRGFIFLFNAGQAERVGSIPLNQWIGLTEGDRYAVRELYPGSRDYGVYAMGDELMAVVPPKQASVLELTPSKDALAPATRPTGMKVDRAFLTLKEILSRLRERDLRLVP